MKFLNFTAGAGLLLGTLLLAQPSWAQDHAQHSHAHGPASAAEAQELTSGEVRRIDMGVSDTSSTDRAMDGLFGRAGFSTAGRVYYRIECSP